jgi:hypothetical protein
MANEAPPPSSKETTKSLFESSAPKPGSTLGILQEFQALSLAEKALTIAQTQSALFSNFAVRAAVRLLRKPTR